MRANSDSDLEKIWKNALKVIKEEVPVSSFQAWIKPANLVKIEDNKAYLEVKNEFSRNLILQNYERSISKGLEASIGKATEIIISINSELNNLNYTPNFASLPDSASPMVTNSIYLAPADDNFSYAKSNNSNLSFEQLSFNAGLNPKFTFDNFIVGSHNQFCHAVALSIAEQNSENTYNPFFIYGDVGLGKTHIMQAVGNYILSKKAQAKVLYITTEKFLNDLISSMRKSKMNEFRDRYRSLDLLMIDDIQFIEGKETTQEEFFHTFNALKDNGSQVILTSDRPPMAIPRLEPRLCSRFEAGLVADVQAPTYETRLAIISAKAHELRMKVPMEISDLIANHFPENIRRLEGAIKKLQAYTSFSGLKQTLTEEWVKKILQIGEESKFIIKEDIFKNKPKSTKSSYFNKKPPIKVSGIIDEKAIEQSQDENENQSEIPKISQNSNKIDGQDKKKLFDLIQEIVCEEFKIALESLQSRDNTQEIKEARQISIYLARNFGLSLVEISLFFDGRGNSAILNAYKKVVKEIKENNLLKQLVEKAEKRIEEKYNKQILES